MSETTTEGRTLRAVPTPEPLTGLMGTPAAIYSELLASPDATVTELALAAGIGRSTAGKALTTLEEHGLAIRDQGERTGPRRTPDRWRCAQGEPTDSSKTEQPDDTVSATPNEPSATKPVRTEEAAKTDASPTPGDSTESEAAAKAPTHGEAPRAPKANSDTATPAPAPADATQAAGPAKPSADEPRHTAGRTQVPVLAPKTRLAPGALRQRVIDHLQAHPQDAFTATRISRVIERSSGAIANSLVILARQGIAEQVSDKPRTYRLASPDAANE
ncbi:MULTISPECIES: helix-turn-helix domain-containing protein [unclassified Streptomyces]|uniref:helix-turn-helix domain-containing protein n=1 Tax=unclassified Streptomyces TaxID=2593676 RepID=UPI00324B4447